MEALTAAVILAWIVIAILAFAMAGLLQQLRSVQAAVTRKGLASADSGNHPVRQLPDSVLPLPGKSQSAVLLVDTDCPVCAEITPVFSELAAAQTEIDFLVLGYGTSEKWDSLRNVRVLSDATAFHLLDPGWRPALIVLDATGTIMATEPVGSVEAVRSVVGKIHATPSAAR